MSARPSPYPGLHIAFCGLPWMPTHQPDALSGVKRRSALGQPVANRTRKVRDVVGVAGRDQIAIDHDGYVVAPEAPVLLHDRPDDKVGVLAGEMEPREVTAGRDS